MIIRTATIDDLPQIAAVAVSYTHLYGYGARESSDCFRTEDHACASKPPDGKVCQPQCGYDQMCIRDRLNIL